MTEPSKSDHDSIEVQMERLNLEIASAQLQKLRLEIENLKPKRSFARYIPLITAAISICGFLWGVYLFLDQQERDRLTRETEQIGRDQNQYRTSYEQLLQFASNSQVTVSRVLFLRQDLYALIDALYPPDRKPEDNRREKEKLTQSIFELINEDCDFTQRRHVQLDIAALRNWSDYQKGLQEAPNTKVIAKYIQALGDLHFKYPKSVENLRYNGERGGYEYQTPEEPLIGTFEVLVDGFTMHLNLLTDADRTEAIAQFNRVTNNPILTADLFPPARIPSQ